MLKIEFTLEELAAIIGLIDLSQDELNLFISHSKKNKNEKSVDLATKFVEAIASLKEKSQKAIDELQKTN